MKKLLICLLALVFGTQVRPNLAEASTFVLLNVSYFVASASLSKITKKIVDRSNFADKARSSYMGSKYVVFPSALASLSVMLATKGNYKGSAVFGTLSLAGALFAPTLIKRSLREKNTESTVSTAQ